MARPIRFLLDGEVASSTDVDPTLTVLDWLRDDARRTGTKEGCAEGDCGACTVVLGELRGGKARAIEPVNACILFAAQLDGRELITVEDLRGADGALHPVQQAMVDCHGSQCGFCTPGFVMTLFARYQRAARRPTRPAINDALAGNLCRCTGYGPIVDGGAGACAASPARPRRAAAHGDAGALAALADDEDVCIGDDERRFFAPRTLDALAALYATHPDATFLAGATDVGLWVTKQHRDLPTRHLARPRSRSCSAHRGPARRARASAPRVTLCRRRRRHLAALHPDSASCCAGSAPRRCATRHGRRQHRQRLADRRHAAGADRARRDAGAAHAARAARTLPLEDFFLAYGKQDRAAGRVRRGASSCRSSTPAERFRCYKISKRFDQDISAVLRRLQLRRRRTARSPRRASPSAAWRRRRSAPRRAEAALIGQPWTEATVAAPRWRRSAQDFTPLTDMRASAGLPRCRRAQNLLLQASASRPPAPARDAHRRRARRWPWLTPAHAAPTDRGGVHRAASPMTAPHKHVAGEALYIDDIREPAGLLHVCARPCATRAHARITRLDLAAVRAAPGVVARADRRRYSRQERRQPDRRRRSAVRRRTRCSSTARRCSPSPPRPATQARARRAAGHGRIRGPAGRCSTIDDGAAPPTARHRARHDACAAATPRPRIAAAPHALDGPHRASAARSTSISKARSRSPCRARTATCSSIPRPSIPTEMQHIVAHVLGVPTHAVTVEVRRMGGGFGGKETPGRRVRRDRRAGRAQDRPARQDPPRPRRRHDHDRQAPRLRDRLRGRLRRRRAASRGIDVRCWPSRCGYSADLSGADQRPRHVPRRQRLLPAGRRASSRTAARPTPSPTPPSAASAGRRA